MSDRYDPNQPRVPKGHSNGGEWTRGSHGFQPIYFAPVRPPKNPSDLQRAFVAPLITAAETIRLGLLLLTLQATPPVPGTRRVGVFKVTGDTRTAEELKFEGIKPMTDDEVKKLCSYHKIVIKKLNEAATKVNDELQTSGAHVSAAVYGTKVHHELAEAVKPDRSQGIKVEFSIAKAKLEAGIGAREARTDALNSRYGKKGTIRLDVVQRQGGALCIFDAKTGNKGFTEQKMKEYAGRSFEAYQMFSIERAEEIQTYVAKSDIPPRAVYLIQVNPNVPRPDLKAR